MLSAVFSMRMETGKDRFIHQADFVIVDANENKIHDIHGEFIMSKNNQQRILDTIQFLQNTTIVPVAERNAVIAFIAAHLPPPNSPQYNQLSNDLSLGHHFGSDPNQRRNMVRALFLIWKCIQHADGLFILPQVNAGQISQGTVQDRLISYIYKARCVHEAAGAAHILNTVFPANPLAFLAINKVYVAGSSAFDAANAPVNHQNFNFGYDPGRDRYVFQTAPLANAYPTQVESVTAFHWTDARHHGGGVPGALNIATANFTQMTGIRLSGANPMITTQFTGCAFCMAEYGGDMYCAHLSPYVGGMANNTDGATLAKRVMVTNNGQFQNAGGTNVRVFGRDKGHAPNPGGYNLPGGGGAGNYMTIVGFPGGGSYRLYSQTTVGNQIRGTPVQIY